jgi:hypothetical protein
MTSPASRPFTLRLHFIGLCTFVPDGENAVHVLLPATGEHGGGHPAPGEAAGEHRVERHAAALAGCVRGDSIKELQSCWPFLDLQGRALRFGLRSARTPVEGPEMPDISPIAKAKVPRRLLQNPPKDESKDIAARVTLHAGAWGACALSATFDLVENGNPLALCVPLSPRSCWDIRCQSSAELSITLDDREIEPDVLLRPDPARALDDVTTAPDPTVIHLAVFHVPPCELPPFGTPADEPDAGDVSPHFPGHYKVLPDAKHRPDAIYNPQTFPGVSVGTCMQVRAQAEPA